MKHYEDMRGGRGRAVFYRPDRYRARDIFRRGQPSLTIGSISHTLDDISLNGIGATAAPEADLFWGVGERVPIELDFSGMLLFAGQGRIARAEPTALGTKVGIQLIDACLNVPQLVAKSEEILVRRGLDEIVALDGVVNPEYRRLCADVLHLLRTYRHAFQRFSEANPTPAMIADMFGACEERALPRWRSLWYAANSLLAPIVGDPTALTATKRFTELVVTPEFLDGPIWRRSFEKPLGYPGDFQIMNMVYDWRREGESLFSQFLHRLGLEAAECVATRMTMMREEIANKVLDGGSDRTVRITNLGCGSSREVADYLQAETLANKVNFTLIDQDHDALSHVYERSYPEVIRHKGQANVTCLHATFAQLMKADGLFGKLPKQDLIYSLGLTDYLNQNRARRLVSDLFDQLVPSGTLVIGNILRSPRGVLWPMEFVCDWNIVDRDEADMKALAQNITGAKVTTSLDGTGCVCLLRIQKT